MTPNESYQRDGFYLHTESTLTPETLEAAARGLSAVRAGDYDTGEAPHGRSVNPDNDPSRLCKLETPQLASAALRAALVSPALGALAGAVTGGKRVQVWWVQGLYKPGASGQTAAGNVGWHQDEHYWGDWEEGSELFTAWLALSDVRPESGPMIFVPGSHRWGMREGGNFFSQDQDALKSAIAIPEGESWNEVQVVLPPGGVSFHHRRLFHGSHQNTSALPRMSLAIHMCTENAKIRPESQFAVYLDRPEICPVIFGA